MSVGVCPGRRSDRSWCEPLKDLIVKGEPQTLCLLKRLALTSGYVLRICPDPAHPAKGPQHTHSPGAKLSQTPSGREREQTVDGPRVTEARTLRACR